MSNAARRIDDECTLPNPSGAARVLALTVGLVFVAGAAAQTAQPEVKQAAPAQVGQADPSRRRSRLQPTFKLILEPRAMDLLKAISAKLAAAKSMSFTAVVGYEYPSKLGPPIVYSTRYDVTMQRPDKLRILIPGDGPASEFYYDGKTMTAYAPVENLAAVADAPPTIDAALDAAYKNAAIFFPFEDLLVADPYAAHDERCHPRLLHRAFRGNRRNEDRHGGLGQQRRFPADLDRRGRQAAAQDPGDLRRGSVAHCATSWSSRTGSSIR